MRQRSNYSSITESVHVSISLDELTDEDAAQMLFYLLRRFDPVLEIPAHEAYQASCEPILRAAYQHVDAENK